MRSLVHLGHKNSPTYPTDTRPAVAMILVSKPSKTNGATVGPQKGKVSSDEISFLGLFQASGATRGVGNLPHLSEFRHATDCWNLLFFSNPRAKA